MDMRSKGLLNNRPSSLNLFFHQHEASLCDTIEKSLALERAEASHRWL